MAKKLACVNMIHSVLLGSGSVSVRRKTQRGVKLQRANEESWRREQELHLAEMDKLDREIPLPDEKTRGFVFRH